MPIEILVFLLVVLIMLVVYMMFALQSQKIDGTEKRIEILILRLEEKMQDAQNRVTDYHLQSQKQNKLIQDLIDRQNKILDNHTNRIDLLEAEVSIIKRQIKDNNPT